MWIPSKLFNDLFVSVDSFLVGTLQEICLTYPYFVGDELVQIGFSHQSSKRKRLKSMKRSSFLTGSTIYSS